MEGEYSEPLEKYNYGDLLIETKYWLVLLAPDQRNLGTCVVALKRDEESLSGLKKSEWRDFAEIVQNLESALKKAFSVTMFNWGCLLNSGYRKDPPDCHLHWHLIPRYKKQVLVGGHLFKDPCFGESTMNAREDPPILAEEVKKEIIDTIRTHLKYLNRKTA
ncbi:MAG: HIT family protein [Methanobacteriaceae archaeon]